MSPSSKSVAIIGAGVSGLAAASNALREGLAPTVFESAPDLGGMWNAQLRPCWQSMRVNVSKFSTVLSDLPWPAGSPLFPDQASVQAYLSNYAATKIPAEVLKFGVRVELVQRDVEGGGWWVTTRELATSDCGGPVIRQRFDFVIVATGFFAEPAIPEGFVSLLSADPAAPVVLHSSQYRGNSQVANRRVIVVGASISAAEIAADAALTASQTVHIAPHGFWALPRLIAVDAGDGNGLDCPAPMFVPLDVAFYKARERPSPSEAKLRTPADWARMSAYLKSICGDQFQQCCGRSGDHTADAFDTPSWITISDLYYQLLAAGKIRLIFDRVAAALSDQLLLTFDPNQRVDIGPGDVVILCTGYRPRFDFLATDILAELTESDGQPQASGLDPFCPLLLHQCMLHPRLPGLAFVGMYRGPFWSVIELQARRLASIFSGSASAPSQADMTEGLASERLVQRQRPRPQFPHPDLVGMCNDLFGSQPTSSDYLLPNAYRLGGPDPTVASELAMVCNDPDGASAAAAIARALYSTRWQFKRRYDQAETSDCVIGVAEFDGSPDDDPGRRLTLRYRETNCSMPYQAGVVQQLVFDASDGSLSLLELDDDGLSESQLRCRRLRLTRSASQGWLAQGDNLSYCFSFRGIRLAKFTLAEPDSFHGGSNADASRITEYLSSERC